MKKFWMSLMATMAWGLFAQAQDFEIFNPVLTATNLRETVTFDFRTSKSFTFSKNDLSNQYATLHLSLGSLQPSGDKPKGNGAELFDWVLTSQMSGSKVPVYTWVGKSRDVTMNARTVYKISITVEKAQGNAVERRSKEEIMVMAQFMDPGIAPEGNEANNMAVANRREMNKVKEIEKAERTYKVY